MCVCSCVCMKECVHKVEVVFVDGFEWSVCVCVCVCVCVISGVCYFGFRLFDLDHCFLSVHRHLVGYGRARFLFFFSSPQFDVMIVGGSQGATRLHPSPAA